MPYKKRTGGYEKGTFVIFCTKGKYGSALFYRTVGGAHFTARLADAKKYKTGLACKRAFNKMENAVLGTLPSGGVYGMSSVGVMKTSYYYGGK